MTKLAQFMVFKIPLNTFHFQFKLKTNILVKLKTHLLVELISNDKTKGLL
jgi:hypothetical protein